MMYGAVNYNRNIHLFNNLIRHSDLHSYNTRNNAHVMTPIYSKSRSQMSIYFTGPKLWNSMPDFIKNATSLSKFKNCLKSYLVDRY